jgi:endoglucanase
MKKYSCLFFLIILTINVLAQQKTWIRINQLGYLTSDVKVAVLVSKDTNLKITEFQVCDALTEQPVFDSKQVKSYGAWAAFATGFRLNFSDLKTSGSYFVKANNVKSPIFRIGNDVYDGTADFLLRYMRQQRCGFNPSLRDSCHTAGGYVVYGDPLPTTSGSVISKNYKEWANFPIFGGWHDASDYLQYVTTTATATFQMLFAYEQNPSVFRDDFQANGLAGKNGIPDILDEAKWGLDWLVQLNPEPNVFFNQICDDRDHRGMRMPNKDTFTYDIKGSLARPVYRVTGKPQGLGKYKNRTTGVASTAGKFSSAFSSGARVLQHIYPQFADSLRVKAINAYEFGKSDTGVCQTAPNRAPYFYEEDSWADDMELAAKQLAINFHKKGYRQAYLSCIDGTIIDSTAYNKADEYDTEASIFSLKSEQETWIGKDTARHYQWYPFINLGKSGFISDVLTNYNEYYEDKEGIEKIVNRGKNNPFQIGTPFIWCSNNYVSAAITQMNLYRTSTNDTTFQEAEAAHRDWLFGCNPWGTSMIYGLPNAKIGANTEGVFPRDPHSAFTHNAKIPIDGGLVDGPIYGSIYGKLIGITLYQPDEFTEFQSPLVVYHDDYGDYSSNEPTMDSYEKQGAINRLDTIDKTIHLVFTGHDFAEGGEAILSILEKQKTTASFFLTGDFMRKHPDLSKKIKKNGHYIGGHSDKHLLYADWQKRDSTLVTRDSFWADLKANFSELNKLGIAKNDASFFMPPYEWYNDSIALWTKRAGLTLINFTSGTSSNADYTTPDMPNYKSSTAIYDRILQYEKTDNKGLNGSILLLHIGVGDKRSDKFWTRLEGLITELKRKGYQFERF